MTEHYRDYRFRIKEKVVRNYDTVHTYYVLDYFSWRKFLGNLLNLATTIVISSMVGWLLRMPTLIVVIYCTAITFLFFTKRNLGWVHISTFDNIESAIEEVVILKQPKPKLDKQSKQWFL